MVQDRHCSCLHIWLVRKSDRNQIIIQINVEARYATKNCYKCRLATVDSYLVPEVREACPEGMTMVQKCGCKTPHYSSLFIKFLPWIRCVSFRLPWDPLKWTLLPLLHRRGNPSTGKCSEWAKCTQLVSGRAGKQTQVCVVLTMCFPSRHTACPRNALIGRMWPSAAHTLQITMVRLSISIPSILSTSYDEFPWWHRW